MPTTEQTGVATARRSTKLDPPAFPDARDSTAPVVVPSGTVEKTDAAGERAAAPAPLETRRRAGQIEVGELAAGVPMFASSRSMTRDSSAACFDVFLSHSHLDGGSVEELARRLADERGIRPWLDRWVLIPGKPWQRETARGLDRSASCAVCLGEQTPRGWFEKEVDKALNRQAHDADFRVIPVLLPRADPDLAATLQDTFLGLNTWVDFREDADQARAFHLLACGVKGVAPGRWQPSLSAIGSDVAAIRAKLQQLQQLTLTGLVDDTVALDVQRKIMERLLD